MFVQGEASATRFSKGVFHDFFVHSFDILCFYRDYVCVDIRLLSFKVNERPGVPSADSTCLESQAVKKPMKEQEVIAAAHSKTYIYTLTAQPSTFGSCFLFPQI